MMKFDMQAALDHLSKKLADAEKLNAINVGVIVQYAKQVKELEEQLQDKKEPEKE